MSVEWAVELQGRAWALQAEGRLEEARQACRDALRLIEESEGADSPDAANLLNDLTEIETERQDFAAAIVLAERARAITDGLGERFTGQDAARVRLKTLEQLGTLRRTMGDYRAAEVDLKLALEIAVAEFGEHSAEAVVAQNDLGVLYKYWGRFEEGLRLFHLALASTPNECLARATVWHNVGGILHAQGEFAAAEEPARTAWDLSRKLLGEHDRRTMLDAAAYAAVLEGLGRYEESEAIYRRSLEFFEHTYGPQHYEIAATLHGLASVLAARGACEQAEAHYRRALVIKEKLLGAESPDAALTRHNLGSLLIRMGRVAETVRFLEGAVAALNQRLSPGHPYVALARETLRKASGREGCDRR
jgi:tetratricopeptide (TPR) repeat protein